MKIISKDLFSHISGGVAMITKNAEIMVTDGASIVINSYEFHSSGIFKYSYRKIDFSTGNLKFYIDSTSDRLIYAQKIDGGYLYSFENMSNVDNIFF